MPDDLWMRLIAGLLAVCISLVAWIIGHRLTHQLLPKFITHTKNNWDDVFMKYNFFRNLAFLVPGLFLYAAVPFVFYGYPTPSGIVQNLITIYLIVTLVLCANSFFNAILEIYHTYPIAKEVPLVRFTRILKYGVYSCAFLLVLGLILNKSLFYFFHRVDKMGTVPPPEGNLSRFLTAAMAIFISIVAWYICRHVTLNVIPKLVSLTKNKWDDALVEHNVFNMLVLFVPGLILNAAVPMVFYYEAKWAMIAQNIVGAYLIFVAVLCVSVLLGALLEIYQNYPLSKDIPLSGFVILLRIVFFVGGIFFIKVLFENHPQTDPENGLKLFLKGLGFAVVAFVAWYICQHIAHNYLPKLVANTKNKWDDALVNNGFFRNLALIVPGIILNMAIPNVLYNARGAMIAQNIVWIYLLLAVILCADALLSAFLDIYRSFPLSEEIPLTQFVQVLKIILYSCGFLFALALVLNRSPLYIFSGLGAMTAILMLIFKDPILGFVAGLQLISNKMLKQGDWIEMGKYGADGDVIDITLTTVKVRNFDKTITTIPTYALIADSFKNWRGMKESGGRRIKRAIYIDINSICFCSKDILQEFAKNKYISEYIKDTLEKNIELLDATDPSKSSTRPTNIGMFRQYIHAYLSKDERIHQEGPFTFIVRQLAPTASGVPLEIYVFCRFNIWAEYEEVQSDIFDHLLAIVPEFNLRVYQLPSGGDVKVLEHVLGSRHTSQI